MAQAPLRKQLENVYNGDVSQYIVTRVSDIFAATLVYAAQLAEQELSRCTLPEQHAVNLRYGYTHRADVVTALVREAADRMGVELRGYSVGKVETEKVAVPPKLISFEDLIDEIMKISE